MTRLQHSLGLMQEVDSLRRESRSLLIRQPARFMKTVPNFSADMWIMKTAAQDRQLLDEVAQSRLRRVGRNMVPWDTASLTVDWAFRSGSNGCAHVDLCSMVRRSRVCANAV